jgi:DNA (cytosine-5)-methyltransferase 1
MSLFDQQLLGLHDELIVDLFAGGGGASVGIEMATGRQVDYAINHDREAVSLHEANHPQTEHLRADVWEVDPHEVAKGRPVGLLWASPDCTDHSKAKGGKPIRNKKRRALAWVVKRWAGQVQPRVIIMENVEEFVDWGPLVGPPGKLRRCPDRKGRTFNQFVAQLEELGYEVEWRELRACDYGAPTIRKRLFIVARCDGEPIVWPEPTHGPETGRRYRTAAECIDWTIPMCSIFATPEEAKEWARAQRKRGWKMGTPRRPLADATMRRIARGVVQYVLEAAEPFVLSIQNYGWGDRNASVGDPLRTVTAYPKGGAFALVAPYLIPRYGEREGQKPRTRDIQEPAPVIVPTGNGASLAAAFLAKHYGGNETPGWPLDEPISTVTTQDHHAVVAAFLQTYYGNGTGQDPDDPLRTITTKDRMGLVTCLVDGEPYAIVDIAMRMLQPRELYTAQGFPVSYRIERGADGERLTKTAQVRMVGNSVSPPIAAALVRANVPAMIARDEQELEGAMSA